MQKNLTQNIVEYEVKPTSQQGYILSNESEKLLIHKSLLAGGGAVKYAPYCLKDITTGKHLTGMFVSTKTEIPTFYYYQDNYKYTIVVNEEEQKALIKKHKKKAK